MKTMTCCIRGLGDASQEIDLE
jgi:hypothetical protein